MKKTICLALLLVFCAIGAGAQTQFSCTIKGTVVDSATMKSVGFATIALRYKTTPVKATAAGADGEFSLKYGKPGDYTVQVTFVGYLPFEKSITIKDEKVIDLGTIPISAGVQIGDVVVVGQLITTDIDKTIYNTAADPETPVLTALEMLRKVPMLSVDGDDNLQMQGQNNYKILVNGKSNTMMTNNYKDVLRSMPASSIKNVEVMTNPPAKYDAEGIAGIINIITNRKTNNGYNGSLSVRSDHFGGLGGNGYIAASLGKLSLSVNGGVGQYKSPESTSWSKRINELSEDVRYINQNSNSKVENQFYNLSFDLSYEVDTFNLVTASFWGFAGNYSGDTRTYGEYLNSEGVRGQYYNNTVETNGNFGGLSGNIDWQRTFMKPEKMLTMSYRIDANPGGSSYQSDLVGFGGYEERHQRSDNNSIGSEHTFQVDYFEPFAKKHVVEVGAKFVLRPNNSDTYNEELVDDIWIEDLERKNDLDYMQYIMSGYGSYQFKLKKFSVKGGLRAEFTINTGTFKQEVNNKVFNRYFNVVPYVTTSYKLSDSQTLKVGYTQRLMRPGIWYLNPYVNDQDPMNISTGNPNLESDIRHSFELSYNSFTQKANFGANFNVNFGNKAIENVSELQDDGVMLSTYENCGRRQNYSLYGFGGVNFLEGKMRINLKVNGQYSIMESTRNSDLNNSGFGYGFGGSIYVQTWKNANINIFGDYRSSNIALQSKSSSRFYSSFNLSQSFLKDKKLTLNLGISNPFETKRVYRNETFGTGFSSMSEYTYYSRRFNLSLKWNFGKTMTEVKKARRGINNEDKMSEGESQGGGGAAQ